MSWFLREHPEVDADAVYVYGPSGHRYRCVTPDGCALHLKRLSDRISKLGDDPDVLVYRADQDELISAWSRLILAQRKAAT